MKFTFPPESKPLDGYTIKRAIGRGGFGEVYYALSDAGKEVALKLLLHNMDVELRGVSQCLNLKHPNLVTIFDMREDKDGDHWIVMEYVSGKSLVDVLDNQKGPLPLDEIKYWLNGIVAGLSFLHDRGIVHRDLKPANVYNENEIVKIGDVGLAKYISQSRRNAQTESVGTVYYMAPEVAHGKYGHEVDIYSLGVVLYEMLTGKLPFDGESTGEILMKHLTEKPDLSLVPPQFHSIITRSLEKDPQKRIPSMTQLGIEFQTALDGKEPVFEIPVPPLEQAEANDASVDLNNDFTEGIPKLKHHAKEFGKEAEKYARHYSHEAQVYARKMAKNAQDYANKQKEVHNEWVNNKNNKDHSFANKQYSPQPPPYQNTAPSDSDNSSIVKTIGWIFLILISASVLGVRAATGMLQASFTICILGGIVYFSYKAFRWILGLDRRSKIPDSSLHSYADYEPPRQEGFYNPEIHCEKPNKKHYRRQNNKNCGKRKRSHVYYGPDTIRSTSAAQKINSLLYSMIYSILFATLFSGCLYALDFLSLDFAGSVIFGIAIILSSWAIMIPTKIWEGHEVDDTIKRIIMLPIGAAVGAVIFLLMEGLELVGRNDPNLVELSLFFAGLFFLQRWWLQADSFRKKRFRIRLVLGSLCFAFIAAISLMRNIEVPITCMAAVSCVVQLSSGWVPRHQREHIVKNT